MSGTHILIAAIFVVFVIAFLIVMLVLNASAGKIISSNKTLVEKQNALMEQNMMQDSELVEQRNELEEQKEMIELLRRQQEELAQQLKGRGPDEVMLLRELTADMSDAQLMEWIDQKMDETRLFTDSSLTLKTTAKALGLTQKRLSALFRNHPKYGSLNDYLNEKRFLLACRLLREEPHWTIEAVGAEAGFGGRRTFQTEVKRRLGITPLQYRQSQI